MYRRGYSQRYRPTHNDNGGNTTNQSRPDGPLALVPSRDIPRGPSAGKPKVDGTKVDLGQCSVDDNYKQQSHHYLVLMLALKLAKPSKPYRVTYDPETDGSLSKTDRKLKKREYTFSSTSPPFDPRTNDIVSYFQKPNKLLKKFPFKQLPQAKYPHSKELIGPAPQTQLVLWDLPLGVTEAYMMNFFKGYGNPKNIKFYTDEDFAVPLGIARFEFEGSPDKSMVTAKRMLLLIRHGGLKIDGADLHIDLDDNEHTLLNERLTTARDVLRAEKWRRDEEERKQRKLDDLKRRNEEKRRLEDQKRQQLTVKRTLDNVTIGPKFYGGRITSGYAYPPDLDKYIKGRPFLMIKARYVSPMVIPCLDVKRCLEQYRWLRIIDDRTGFYVVFKSVKEAERCYQQEDGRKFFEYRMNMEMAIPANWKEPVEVRLADSLVDEAVTMLLKEFQQYLAKDIRERVIAPTVLDLLSHDRYPELVAELKREEEEKRQAKLVVVTNDQLKQNALEILREKQQKQALRRQQKLKVIPLQHALNYESEEDEHGEEDEEEEQEEEEEEEEEVVDRKRNYKPELEDEAPPIKRTKTSMLYESEDDEAKSETEEEQKEVSDYSHLPEQFWPTEGAPMPVFPETKVGKPGEFSLAQLQLVILDDEDLQLAREALVDISEPLDIGNIEYWAWKQNDASLAVHEISENIDLIAELDSHLENRLGLFRLQGYRKIKEAEKIAYLPHKRQAFQKARNATSTEETDDDGTPKPNGLGLSANVSSRVNRANNRRFAADVNAQLGAETEVLNLNALTKRKKPVTFARSTIHNWGLYALEPIAAKEMIIEYVGELIRQTVAEVRERAYMKTGIGSSYLFRIDENNVIDATKKGGIARFINHCCSPSCTAKIIKVGGMKRIVIYALRDIEANEELTYDYKFERETNDDERIRCLCGAPGCKGYLN